MSNRMSALALGGAVVVAGTALAVTQKNQADSHTTAVKVEVDERPMARDNRTLGKFHLTGLPPAPRGIPRINSGPVAAHRL